MTKLTISLATLALMVAPAGVQAQVNTNTNNTIGVSATVGKAFRWSLGQDLLFGTIAPEGDGSTANVTVATNQLVAAGGRQAGYVSLYFNAATNVTVAAPASLAGGLGGTLAVTFTCGAATSGNGGTLDVLASGACADADVLSLTLSGTGSETVDIFFGGTLAGADVEAAAADTYTGTITLTAVQP
ncbi:MAG TPA: hypothetical protein VMK65_03615 [Longimicrobiales bacterium]|nr:hypothetical protein [Longimicrobiales bacterium]